MIIPGKVRDIFDAQEVISFATADGRCVPNVVPIYWKTIVDEDTVLILDNYLRASKKNIEENDQVCLACWGKGGEAYKLKGTATYHQGDEVYDLGRDFMRSKKPQALPRGVVRIKINEIYTLKAGPEAGMPI